MSIDCVRRLAALPGKTRELGHGERAFSCGEPVRRLHLVLDGEVHLYRHTAQGDRLVLQRARTGEVLAEASVHARRYHCDAIAVHEPTTVRSVSVRRVLRALAEDPALSAGWHEMLARELQSARGRAELLRLRGIGARLDTWLALGDDVLPPRGEWRALADELGVTPEALYRELARRRKGA